MILVLEGHLWVIARYLISMKCVRLVGVVCIRIGLRRCSAVAFLIHEYIVPMWSAIIVEW